jgi:hypothetical protein
MKDKTAVGVGIVALALIVVGILVKLAIIGLVVWGLWEGVQYLASLNG